MANREEDIINSIMESSDVTKSEAIAIAKDQDLLKQKGEHLVPTKEGKNDDDNKKTGGKLNYIPNNKNESDRNDPNKLQKN